MAAHGGNTKKRSMLNRKNGSRTKTKPGQTYRVYCEQCPKTHNPADPETAVHVGVSAGQKVAICPSGHRMMIA